MSDFVTDLNCGLTWDDSISTSMTPAPSARCPFEYFHEYDESGEVIPLDMEDIPASHPVQPVSDGFVQPDGTYMARRKTAASRGTGSFTHDFGGVTALVVEVEHDPGDSYSRSVDPAIKKHWQQSGQYAYDNYIGRLSSFDAGEYGLPVVDEVDRAVSYGIFVKDEDLDRIVLPRLGFEGAKKDSEQPGNSQNGLAESDLDHVEVDDEDAKKTMFPWEDTGQAEEVKHSRKLTWIDMKRKANFDGGALARLVGEALPYLKVSWQNLGGNVQGLVIENPEGFSDDLYVSTVSGSVGIGNDNGEYFEEFPGLDFVEADMRDIVDAVVTVAERKFATRVRRDVTAVWNDGVTAVTLDPDRDPDEEEEGNEYMAPGRVEVDVRVDDDEKEARRKNADAANNPPDPEDVEVGDEDDRPQWPVDEYGEVGDGASDAAEVSGSTPSEGGPDQPAIKTPEKGELPAQARRKQAGDWLVDPSVDTHYTFEGVEHNYLPSGCQYQWASGHDSGNCIRGFKAWKLDTGQQVPEYLDEMVPGDPREASKTAGSRVGEADCAICGDGIYIVESGSVEDVKWHHYSDTRDDDHDPVPDPSTIVEAKKTATTRHTLADPNVWKKLEALPALYATDGMKGDRPAVRLFNPYGNGSWIIWEYDPATKEGFGWADLGYGELGYIPVSELASIPFMGKPGLGIERDTSVDTMLEGFRASGTTPPNTVMSSKKTSAWVGDTPTWETGYTWEEEGRVVRRWTWDGNDDIFIEDNYIVREVETTNLPEVTTKYVVDEQTYFSWTEDYEYGDGSALYYETEEKAKQAAMNMANSVQPYMFADYKGASRKQAADLGDGWQSGSDGSAIKNLGNGYVGFISPLGDGTWYWDITNDMQSIMTSGKAPSEHEAMQEVDFASAEGYWTGFETAKRKQAAPEQPGESNWISEDAWPHGGGTNRPEVEDPDDYFDAEWVQRPEESESLQALAEAEDEDLFL